ncbi:unnamed protein product [Cylicocyclus nassatus]|uniref:RING-type domain-containing protein n=1 Tax=Cylicocyclus nassatus TaxID=53992 RepID=A0AA36M4U2_CYLNA|nr:unnamed protein product [Cylicocyclus nassatus]
MLCEEGGSSTSVQDSQQSNHKRKASEDPLATMDKKCLIRDFACILCQRICNVPVATTVCMHRFCEGCMNPRIAAGNLRCPRCNMQLDPLQPVCHDSNFEDIIAKIGFDLTTVHDLCARKPHSTSSDEEYMDMCNVSEERRKIIRKKNAPHCRIHPLAAEHAFYWDRKFSGSNVLVQRYLKKMGLPHSDPPVTLPKIPEHDGVDAEERRPFRIYGNLINHVPPPLRDKRARDLCGYDAEYKLFECNKDHVWPTIERKEPNRFGITAEYRKNLAKVTRMSRSKSKPLDNTSSDLAGGDSGDEKPLAAYLKSKSSEPHLKADCEADIFLEKEANGESSINGSDTEDFKDFSAERHHLYLNRQSAPSVAVILRPNRNPKSSSRLVPPRELPSFYLFVDEKGTIAHIEQFVVMRISSKYPRSSGKISVVLSSILWECKAARMAMLQCMHESNGHSSSQVTPSKNDLTTLPEIEAPANSTAYSVSTKDDDSTVYATEFPVKKLEGDLQLCDMRDAEKKSVISLLYTVAPSTD